jgi:hypothetical protein
MAEKTESKEGARAFSKPCPVAMIFADGKRVDSKNAQLLDALDSTGGKSLASARIRVRLKEPYTQPNLHPETGECEILLSSQVGGKTRDKVVFWGKFSGLNSDISDGESVVLEARQAPYHFGNFVQGMPEYNANTQQHQLLRQAIEFNPTVNFTSYSGKRIGNTRGLGVVRGNMNDLKPYGKGKCNVFLDPASVHTPQARKFATGRGEATTKERQGDLTEARMLASDKKWTLKEAVYYLCWTLNEDEKNFQNPTREELKPLDDSKTLLHDLVIPLGTFLPEALDRVLDPFGYGWRVDYVRKGVRKITVMQRGKGPKKTLRLQSPGEVLDLKKTNLESSNLACGNQSLINRVVALGDFKLYESTWELKRAWSAEHDDLTTDELSQESLDWATHPERHRVWRDWVLNEAGDLIGVREGVKTPYDFKPIFEVDTVPRRRRFHPCITLAKDRLPACANGYFVEYYDGAEWRPIGGYEVLTAECGISFNGTAPPAEMLQMGDVVKVRITASVYSDERIAFTTPTAPSSPQPDAAPVLLDVSDRFHFRHVHEDSEFLKGEMRGLYEDLQVDDTKRLQEFAERIVKATDHLDVRGTAVIWDLDGDPYDLGDMIEKIEGRNISLDAGGPSSGAEKKYPQIVGITYDYTSQKRILALETFRDARYA